MRKEKHMNIDFSQEELQMLSISLLSRIRSNCEAEKLIYNSDAIQALNDEMVRLRVLNTKICNLLEECDESD